MQWVVLAYLLIATALVMPAAPIGDVYGKKRHLFGSRCSLRVAAVRLSPPVGWLIACRALQGLGAVFVSRWVRRSWVRCSPRERGRAMGMIGSAVLGVAIGPSVGGLIIELAGWRWMFW
jgi:MFS family permease